MFKFLARLLLLSCIVIGGTTTRAQSLDATLAATSFLQNFDEGESITEIYSTLLGDRFRKVLSANEFTARVEALRTQLAGKPKDRQLFFSSSLERVPESPTSGNFHLFRYSSTYPVGRVIQEVLLELENGEWKVINFDFRRAPQGR